MQSVTLTRGLRTNSTDGLVKDIFEALLRQRGALEELDGAYLLCNRDALLVCEWLHAAAWVMSNAWNQSVIQLSVGRGSVQWGVNERYSRAWVTNIWADTGGNVVGEPNWTRRDDEWIRRRRTGHGAYRSS
jgi:hypothetical protein